MKFVNSHFVIAALALALLAFFSMVFSPAVYSAETITEAFTTGKTSANLRYRYETVDEDISGKEKASASTVRLRLGYETAEFYGVGAMVEAEHLTALGSERYNSLANGKTTYSTVADPEFTEINQAYLSYSGIPATKIKYGRQLIALDNQRFIGNVGWRQNEQTFDAFSVANESFPATKITAAYLMNANRVFSDNAVATSGAAAGNFKMSSPLVNVSYKGWNLAEIVGYAYLLAFELPANYGNSTKTYGLRMKGSAPMGDHALLYTAEYATQSNYKNNPASYRNNYSLLEGGIDIKVADFKLGYEVLEGDGVKSFSTPLATLHAFNGWVDMFLATPATGLKDMYASAGTALAGIKLGVVYHDYSADTGGANYGTEWNLIASKNLDKNYAVGAKFGRFSSDSEPARVDTDKLWLWAEAKF